MVSTKLATSLSNHLLSAFADSPLVLGLYRNKTRLQEIKLHVELPTHLGNSAGHCANTLVELLIFSNRACMRVRSTLGYVLILKEAMKTPLIILGPAAVCTVTHAKNRDRAIWMCLYPYCILIQLSAVFQHVITHHAKGAQ